MESDSEERVGYDVCWLTCGPSGALWPAPKQVNSKTEFDPFFTLSDAEGSVTIGPAWQSRCGVQSARSAGGTSVRDESHC